MSVVSVASSALCVSKPPSETKNTCRFAPTPALLAAAVVARTPEDGADVHVDRDDRQLGAEALLRHDVPKVAGAGALDTTGTVQEQISEGGR